MLGRVTTKDELSFRRFFLSRAPRPGVDTAAMAPPSTTSDPDDAALVRALRSGEVRAFDTIYARFRPRIFSFLLRLARRRDVAEDLLQETFLRLAKHAATLAEDTTLSAWLFTVARNLWRSHRRWRLLDAERLRELGLLPGTSPTASPLALTEASETERRLEAALAALPETYREVLLLVAVERLEPQQAAEVLGLRADALRQRLARARAMLGEALAQDEAIGTAVRGAAT
jgi:RNA polymerase sigma-70 factor (ECF subfamily)